MADFVDDYTDTPETKVDATSIPASASTTKYVRAADINALSTAAASLRTAILAGKTHGLRDVTSEPSGVSGRTQFFSKNGAAYVVQGAASSERVIQRTSFGRFAANASGTGDNTSAMASALAAVVVLGGGELFIPNGTYRLTSNVQLPAGVTLVGESRDGCILLVDHPDATTDGITLPSNGASYTVGGGLRNLTVKANSQSTCRDCVSLNLASNTRLDNLTVLNAGRYGVYMGAVLDVDFTNCKVDHSKTAGLYVDTQSAVVSTTVRVDGCYFRDTTEGAGVDVACNGIDFIGCIFESNGSTTRSAGVGARVRSNAANFVAPYFENNAVWDVDAGTDSSQTAQVSILGFTLVSGGYKQAGYGGFRFDYCNAGLVCGGFIPAMSKSVVFRSHCSGVNTSGIQYTTTEVEWEGTGGISKYPGIVQGQDGTTGAWKLDGAYAIRIGGGPQLQTTLSGSASYAGSASVANGGYADTTITVTGAVVGHTVMGVSMGGNLDTGFSYCAWVSANNTVTVRFVNNSGSAGTVAARTLKALVIGYA